MMTWMGMAQKLAEFGRSRGEALPREGSSAIGVFVQTDAGIVRARDVRYETHGPTGERALVIDARSV